MRIQTINTGMINKTFQKSDQTMPMAKTNNANSSPVVDNNITYSIYGKNSSGGTVAFAGLGNSIADKVKECVTKRTADYGEKLAQAIKQIEKSPYRWQVKDFKNCVSQFEKKCAEDGSPLFDGDEILNMAMRLYRITYPGAKENFLETASELAQITRNGNRVLRGEDLVYCTCNLGNRPEARRLVPELAKLTTEAGMIPSRDLCTYAIDIDEACTNYESAKKVIEWIPRVANLKSKLGTHPYTLDLAAKDIYDPSAVDIAIQLTNHKSPEKLLEMMSKILQIDPNDKKRWITTHGLYYVANDLIKTETPEKALKFLPKATELTGINGKPLFCNEYLGALAIDLARGDGMRLPKFVLAGGHKMLERQSGIAYLLGLPERDYIRALALLRAVRPDNKLSRLNEEEIKSIIDRTSEVSEKIWYKRMPELLSNKYTKGYSSGCYLDDSEIIVGLKLSEGKFKDYPNRIKASYYRQDPSIGMASAIEAGCYD